MRGLGGLAKVLPLLAVAVGFLVAPASPAASLSSPLHPARNGIPSLPALPGSRQATNSSNWSGYVASGGTFTSITGSWTQPSVSCSGKAAQYSTFWIGMDGFEPGDKGHVEQVGTDSDCTAGDKKRASAAYYFAWWDIYPENFQTFPSSSCPVSAGDSLTADVSVSNGEVSFSISDSTQGWRCTASQTLSPPALSAEWIVEAPTLSGTRVVLPLANFGSVDFTSATANSTQLSSLSSVAITMESAKGATKASVSPLGSDGQSFSVTWVHS